MTTNEWYEETINWQKTMHKATSIKKEMINYQNSVHGCIPSAVSVLSRHFHQEVNGVEVAMPQETYMSFIDLKEYLDRTGKTLDQIIKAGWSRIWWYEPYPYESSFT